MPVQMGAINTTCEWDSCVSAVLRVVSASAACTRILHACVWTTHGLQIAVFRLECVALQSLRPYVFDVSQNPHDIIEAIDEGIIPIPDK
jgi:hypothetical protein